MAFEFTKLVPDFEYSFPCFLHFAGIPSFDFEDQQAEGGAEDNEVGVQVVLEAGLIPDCEIIRQL